MQKYIAFKDEGPRAALKLFAYYVQRLCTSRQIRFVATRTLVAGLRIVHGRPLRRDLHDMASVNTMRTQGFVRLQSLLSAHQIDEMLSFLRQQNMVAVRGTGASFDMGSVPAETSLADYPSETVINCPHVMELANHPDVLDIAARYLGYTPTITLISMRWSFPGSAPDSTVQAFHRDSEPGSIKLLVYLTDVDEDSGPHRYVAGSHRDRMPIRLHRYGDHEVNVRHGGSVAILGPAGTALMIDSKGIHKGATPRSSARLLLGIQYSLLPCAIYEYTPVTYRGKHSFDPYINRLMVKPH